MDRLASDAVSAPGSSAEDHANWIMLAIRRGDVTAAEERLALSRKRWSVMNWTPVEAEVLMMGRDYRRASSLIASSLLTARNPQDAAHLKELKLQSDLMRSISARIKAREQQGHPDDLGVYVINLDENPERWDRITRLTRPRTLRRIGGVPGRYLADELMPRFGPQVSAGVKGTLGCFLSHYAAWEAHLKSGEDYALILEDDCIPLVDIPRTAAALMVPDDFDVCFLTTGLGVLSQEAAHSREALPLYRPIPEAVALRVPHLIAPGGYGYVLSRRGAGELIARTGEDGFYGDVDWRMIAYCLPPGAIESYPLDSFAVNAIGAHLRVLAGRPPLAGYACCPGLVRPGKIGSVRLRDNDLQHAHLGQEPESA